MVGGIPLGFIGQLDRLADSGSEIDFFTVVWGLLATANIFALLRFFRTSEGERSEPPDYHLTKYIMILLAPFVGWVGCGIGLIVPGVLLLLIWPEGGHNFTKMLTDPAGLNPDAATIVVLVILGFYICVGIISQLVALLVRKIKRVQ